MRPQILARKIQRNVEDYGWRVAAKKSLVKFLAPIYERQVYVFYKKDLERTSRKEGLETRDFIFKLLDPWDKPLIEQIEALAEFLWNEVEERLAAGDLCVVALHNGKLAGFNLVAFGDVYIPLIKLRRVFRRDEAWSVQISIHKDFRKRGLGSQLRYRVFDELRGRGIKRLYGGTVPSNVANRKLSSKVGFQEFAHLEYTNVLGFKTRRYRRVQE